MTTQLYWRSSDTNGLLPHEMTDQYLLNTIYAKLKQMFPARTFYSEVCYGEFERLSPLHAVMLHELHRRHLGDSMFNLWMQRPLSEDEWDRYQDMG